MWRIRPLQIAKPAAMGFAPGVASKVAPSEIGLRRLLALRVRAYRLLVAAASS